MDTIFEFIKTYGLAVFVIATIIIAVIGILKLCKTFEKINHKGVKKLIYYILDIALAFGGSAIYFASFKIAWSGYVTFSLTQMTATTTLYAIYENFGARKLIQMFFNWIASKCKTDLIKKIEKVLNKLGVETKQIESIKNIITNKPEEVKNEGDIIEMEEVKNEISIDVKTTEPTILEIK